MAKDEAFYQSYVKALYKRGKSDSISREYINKQAVRVMKPEELERFQALLDDLIARGVIVDDGKELRLVGEP